MFKFQSIIETLLSLNKRDCIGLIGWLLVSLGASWLLGAKGMALCLWLMAAREAYQWHHYCLSRFEWEDVVRYSLVIVTGYLLKILVLGA